VRFVGFSTGALAGSDFRRGVALAAEAGLAALELSALRREELGPLVAALDELEADLALFRDVSFHAPSAFEPEDEARVVALLERVWERGIPIVVHPDVLRTDALWRRFGDGLRIENMDLRKPRGQTASDLAPFFTRLPEARFCLDLAHARQVDPTMAEAERLLLTFLARLDEIHLSHVDQDSRHHRLSPEAVADYQDLAPLVPDWVPLVLESPMGDEADAAAVREEAAAALAVFEPAADGLG
jgi:hypothetical protein